MKDFKDGTTGVIILNGPPLCGKDTIADKMIENDLAGDFFKLQYKDKLIKLTRVAYSLTEDQWDEIYTRDRKEVPTPLLWGRSPREALIHMSETVIKPAFGRDYFGKAAADNIQYNKVNVFSDGGFPEEIAPLIELVGVNHLVVVRLHADGCSYDGDSRSYFQDDGFTLTVDVERKEGYPDQTMNDVLDAVADKIVENM